MKEDRKPTLLYRSIIIIVRAYFRLLYRHCVYGLEHVTSGPAILAANHTSFLDPPIVSISVPNEVFFLARKSLFKSKWFGRLIWALNARPISGEAGDIRVFREIETLLKEGGKVILFPEGTRSKTGELGKMKGGISLIVMHVGCAVIPTYIHGTKEVWGRDRKFPKLSGRTACVFGSPLRWDQFAMLEKKEGHRQFADALSNAILGLKVWYEQGAIGTPP